MKKSLVLSLAVCGVLAATTVSAETRFGAVGFTDGGAGVFLSGDKFIGSAVVGFNDIDGDIDGDMEDTSSTELKVSGAARVAKAGNASILAGATLGTKFADNIGSELQVAVTAGIEYDLAPNVKLLASIDVLSYTTVESDVNMDHQEMNIFNDARVGVAYLF